MSTKTPDLRQRMCFVLFLLVGRTSDACDLCVALVLHATSCDRIQTDRTSVIEETFKRSFGFSFVALVNHALCIRALLSARVVDRSPVSSVAAATPGSLLVFRSRANSTERCSTNCRSAVVASDCGNRLACVSLGKSIARVWRTRTRAKTESRGWLATLEAPRRCVRM